MKSGGGALMVAAAQLLIGLCILGVYEGYKAYFYNTFLTENDVADDSASTIGYADPMDFRSPMGASYYISIVNNIFAIMGLAGILQAQRELIIGFFAYNAAQMVISFHYFVDLCTDTGIKYIGEPSKLTAYEQATTALIFFNFVLSVCATVFAVKSMDEIKTKQREDYNRLSVLSDTLQYEPDNGRPAV
ncbi:hypothetical protein CEUSTIGMA_g6209.t1 [Chlamydomonas eustigma]|uniref:CASP-like protein n=1 Tax=Chlamydomonas eustigma TaxID=1157962 RepID=A0A250X7A6_9CHLO|nr:hypothetical protein CEUSTIGMA_g6209.t1 [Chlamydomonas eustigma]|eukprot:GAX78772.1 hypothetical protein CEUSTIGMA_g6209.t1 [Chlamydomonas eustigma]